MPNFTHHHLFEPGTDPAAAPLLLLHGTGGDEHDLVSLARRLAPNAALLSPRGRVSEHGANRFFARLGEGRFDPAEVTRRTLELADFISAAVPHYGLAGDRLVALGFSNGANVAATLLQLRPDVLAGAILLRPMVVLPQAAAPHSLAGKRVLIASGAHDPIMPADHPEALARLLRAGGAHVTVHTATASHNLVPADLAVAQDFLETR